MDDIVFQQLNRIDDIDFLVDGEKLDAIPQSFNKITFLRTSGVQNVITVEFENYIVEPFDGFDFHQKFNNNTPPPYKTMCGKVLKETEKMYYFDLKSMNGDKSWVGWCPKKSCKIK